MNRGYVKLWRKIEDSGLIQLPNTLALFLHILLNATHKDRKIGTPIGVYELKRGQYMSGRIELASRLKQSEQQIRTSLKRLEELEIITSYSTSRFSVYTIENYNKYQDDKHEDNQLKNQRATSEQPADNQLATTKQELNNLNIKEKHIQPTAAASVCMALSKLGYSDINPANPKLLKLLEAGVSVEEFEGAAKTSSVRKFSYILGIVQGQREQASKIDPDKLRKKDKPWYISGVQDINAKGAEYGMTPKEDSPWVYFKNAVFKKAGITEEMVRAANIDWVSG